MCIICNTPTDELQYLTSVSCSNCNVLTSINLKFAKYIYCNNCPQAVIVDCRNCKSLTTIDLPTVNHILCDRCPIVTYANIPNCPNELLKFPWVNISAEKRNKLVKCQNIFRRRLKYKHFVRYINSEEYFGWFWAGNAPGGKLQKKYSE